MIESNSCLGEMIDASLAAEIYTGRINPRIDNTVRRKSTGERMSAVPKSPRVGTLYRKNAENTQPRKNQAPSRPVEIIEIDITPEKPIAPPVRRLVRSAPRRLLEDFIPVNERPTKRIRLQSILNMAPSTTDSRKKKRQKGPVKITEFFSRKP